MSLETNSLPPTSLNAVEPVSVSRGSDVRQWLIGLLGSWCIVWFAAPWALNSILVRDETPELQTIGLRTGDQLRWRSEGWATTQVGQYGLSGYQPVSGAPVVAIYGDSQVEGHCVNDVDKLCNQVNRLTAQRGPQAWNCVPLARSGADAMLWAKWIPLAEQLWQPHWHVWIVTELSDLKLSQQLSVTQNDIWSAPSPRWVRLASDYGAEALFTAVRRLAIDSSTGRRRELRWKPGKVSFPAPSSTAREPAGVDDETITRCLELNRQLQGRLIILYAPAVPEVQPTIRFDHPDAAWDELVASAGDKLRLIDLRPSFETRWEQYQELPRGFHQGQPYSGHLNRAGNGVIAETIARLLAELPQQDR